MATPRPKRSRSKSAPAARAGGGRGAGAGPKKADPAAPLLFHVERAQRKLAEVGRLAGQGEQTERLAALGTMAAAVAHEISNILTPVKAYAELALRNPEDSALAMKALERAARGVDRASRISELILACARSPRAEAADAAPADIAASVGAAVASLPVTVAGMFPVEVSVEAGLRAAIDPVALEQVLLNLLLNARNAMPAGGKISIAAISDSAKLARVDPAKRDSIRIEITDRGCGMTPQRLARVFEPFVTFAGGGAGLSGHKRTGLGLAICRELIAHAGGRIEAESRVGEGTTVRIVLPAA